MPRTCTSTTGLLILQVLSLAFPPRSELLSTGDQEPNPSSKINPLEFQVTVQRSCVFARRTHRHSSEVFRVFSVELQFSPKPAETSTMQVRDVTEQIHFAIFSDLFFKRRSYRNHVLFCELPRKAEGDKPSRTFR